jgi:uncharacterized membrane protein
MFPTSHFHPMLVHFPIALVAIGFIAELASVFIKKEICLTKVGFYLLIFGTLSALFAGLLVFSLHLICRVRLVRSKKYMNCLPGLRWDFCW